MKVYAGITYHIRGESNLEFNLDDADAAGKCIAQLIKDERDAKNFVITIVPEEEVAVGKDGDGRDKDMVGVRRA
jgi:phosphomannomutase